MSGSSFRSSILVQKPTRGFAPSIQESFAHFPRESADPKSNWQFKTTDARIKLRRLYPQIQME
jgi:hypothetical protein